MTFLVDAYDEEGEGKEARTVLRFHPKIAPVTVAIFPLVKKEGMPEKATEVEQRLRRHFRTAIEINQSIGRRYRRQDEIGTPFCVTIDGETMENDTVTLRERDSMEQYRVSLESLQEKINEAMENWQRPPLVTQEA